MIRDVVESADNATNAVTRLDLQQNVRETNLQEIKVTRANNTITGL